MAAARTRYERAFEAYLVRRGIPYVSVDQAATALLPKGAKLDAFHVDASGARSPATLKTFDFVIYGAGPGDGPRPAREAGHGRGDGRHALIEVKGRTAAGRRARPAPGPASGGADDGPDAELPPTGRLENWVTLDDVESLANWQRLFGPEFRAYLVFLYRLERDADPRLFAEWFEHDGTRYAVLTVGVDSYRASMKTRSPRWRTVDIPAAEFLALAEPLGIPGGAAATARRAPARARPALPARVVEVASP